MTRACLSTLMLRGLALLSAPLAVGLAHAGTPPGEFRVDQLTIEVNQTFANNPVGTSWTYRLHGDGSAEANWTELTYGQRAPATQQAAFEVSPDEVVSFLSLLLEGGFFDLSSPLSNSDSLVLSKDTVEIFSWSTSHTVETTITVRIAEYGHSVRFIQAPCGLAGFAQRVASRLPLVAE